MVQWRRWRFLARTRKQQRDLAQVGLSVYYRGRIADDRIRAMARRCVRFRFRVELDHEWLGLVGRCHEVRGAEHLERLRETRRGAVVAACHFGPMFYLAAELGFQGFDIQVLAHDQVRDQYESHFQRIARRTGQQLETLVAENPRSLLRAVRSIGPGRILVVYIDGNTGVGSEASRQQHRTELEFLGIPVSRRTGVAYLARKAGVPILPAAVYYEGRRRILEVGEPIEVEDGDVEEAQARMTRATFRQLEQYVLRQPEQWHGWFQTHVFWVEAGMPPRAEAARFELECQQWLDRLNSDKASIRLKADPLEHALWRTSEQTLLFDGRYRRLIPLPLLGVRIFEHALQEGELQRLRQASGVEDESLARELARMQLAGFIEVAGMPTPENATVAN